jgi:hypothetical protein
MHIAIKLFKNQNVIIVLFYILYIFRIFYSPIISTKGVKEDPDLVKTYPLTHTDCTGLDSIGNGYMLFQSQTKEGIHTHKKL